MKPEITQYMEEVLARPVEFFDYRKLDRGLWRQYKADAEAILKSEIFNNEINHMITNTIRNTVLSSQNYAQVEQARTYIMALEELKERLRNIEEPVANLSVEEPFESI